MSLIGRPFSQKTRDHFLPLLTSTDWWSGTQTALRRVFEQDSDFKERMFARQIAVMKGQAWNVVETLKTADHGPLELTRRTRVCVWDDIVDIPVAIPMRTPSAEMRARQEAEYAAGSPVQVQQQQQQQQQQEEMDITGASSTGASRPQRSSDLLGPSPPPSEGLPNPSRFSLSRNPSASDVTQLYNEPASPATIGGEPFGYGMDSKDFAAVGSAGANGRPGTGMRAQTAGHLALDHHRRSSSGVAPGRYSFSTRRTNGFLYDDDDAEGDLGFAAAKVKEKHTRKVIVERLETVKSKNPVFTWC